MSLERRRMTHKKSLFHSVGLYRHLLPNSRIRAWVVLLCWAFCLALALRVEACRMHEVIMLHKWLNPLLWSVVGGRIWIPESDLALMFTPTLYKMLPHVIQHVSTVHWCLKNVSRVQNIYIYIDVFENSWDSWILWEFCRMDTLLHKKCCQGDPGCNVSQLKMSTYCNVGMRCSEISFQIEENAVWACIRLQAMLFRPKHPKSPLRPTACLRRLHLLVPFSRHSRLRYLWHLLQKQCWQRSKKQLPTHFHSHTL